MLSISIQNIFRHQNFSLQISAPESDQVAYREAIRYIRRHQRKHDTGSANDHPPILPDGHQPIPSTAVENGSTDHQPTVPSIQIALTEQPDLQANDEWDSESMPSLVSVEHTANNSETDSDTSEEVLEQPELLEMSHSQGWPEEETEPPIHTGN
jgi:hypothetical protein